MAYDEELADRLRLLLGGRGLAEKRMFGGLAFLLDGLEDDAVLLTWAERGLAYAGSLPPK